MQVKYNLDGDLLFSCSKDDTPTVWKTSNGERLGTYDGHQGTVWSLDVSRDSTRLITGGGDQTVKLWAVETGELLASFAQSGPVKFVEWAEGDQSFLVICDPFSNTPAAVRIYTRTGPGDDASSWTYVEWKTLGTASGKKLTRGTWTALNESIITGDDVGVLRVHDPMTGEVKREIKEHSKKINSLQWNYEKTLLITGSADCTSKLFDVNTFRCLRTFETEVPVNAAAISPIKEHVFVAGGQEAMSVTTTSSRVGKFETKLFHMVFGDEFGSVRGHFGPVNTLALHPDGELAFPPPPSLSNSRRAHINSSAYYYYFTGTGFTSGSEDGYIRIHAFDRDYFQLHTEFDNLDELMAMAKKPVATEG